MESLNHSHQDNRNINLPQKHHKTKQKRKTSTISLRNIEKTKIRKSKKKLSMAQIKQEAPEVPELKAKYSLQSFDNHQPSIFNCLQHEDKSSKAILNLTQMTLDETNITQSLQRNEPINLPKEESIEDDIKLVNEATVKEELSTTKEKERNAYFEEKLGHDNELNIYTTMDLSSSNITDKDIPMIIQRIFRNKTKKYTNLVLRDNALTSIGVKILVDELIKSPMNLRNLGLSSNPGIGDAGIKHLIRLLQCSRSITVLALHNTGINNRGVRLLADFLCNTNTDSPSSLEKLYISFNKLITDQSLEDLIRILEQNQTLKVLSLQHCSLSDRARRNLRQISTKKKKRKFSLSE